MKLTGSQTLKNPSMEEEGDPGVRGCISYFSDTVIKCHDQKQLIKGRVTLAHGSRGSIHNGRRGTVAVKFQNLNK